MRIVIIHIINVKKEKFIELFSGEVKFFLNKLFIQFHKFKNAIYFTFCRTLIFINNSSYVLPPAIITFYNQIRPKIFWIFVSCI